MTVWAQVAFVTSGIMLLEVINIASGGRKPVALMAWEFMKLRKSWWLGPIIVVLGLLVLTWLSPVWVYTTIAKF